MDDIEITGSAFDHSSIIASNPSIGSIPINNTAIITSNGFTTANSDAGSVIEVYGYRNYNISENTINTVDSPASTSHGIAIHYSGTTDARNMHTISNNTIFCEESNCTHSISGITLYSSVADITVRNNIHHNCIGIQSLGNSQVKLLGDPTATNENDAQRIINNRRVQLYASQNAFPTQTDHNVIFSAITNDCYVRHDVSALINPPKVDVANNYWGASFNQEVNLCPAGHFDYSPIWDLTPLQAERSSAQQLYATADSLVADSNYTAAKATYQQVVTTYPEKEQAVSSMKAVLYLEPLAGNNFDGLKEWYLNEPAILNNELLLKLSDNLSNKCNEKLESYPEAIAWYENVIQKPETLEDSIFAIIDLEHLYWQMGIDTSLRSASYTGSMPQFKPNSFQSFRDQKDELLRLLYGTKTNVAENEPIEPEDKLFNGSLSQNIPNPCSGKTQICYTLEVESAVQLNIYNYTGQLIKSLNVGIRPEGTYTLVFDAGCLHNGVYFYTLNINGRNSASKKMMVLK
jgi:tetratricopeptide (TPR) repeat protein